jgi:hypothetical protein
MPCGANGLVPVAHREAGEQEHRDDGLDHQGRHQDAGRDPFHVSAAGRLGLGARDDA